MTASCSAATGNVVAYACDPDWVDANTDTSDGCERSSGGIVDVSFSNASAMALSDRIPGMVGTHTSDGLDNNLLYTFDVPDVTAVPDCAGTLAFGCSEGAPVSPAPLMDADLAKYAADTDRAVVTPTPAGSPDHFVVTVRMRLATRGSIPITLDPGGVNASCGLTIDTALDNTPPDVTITGTVAVSDPPGPLQLSGSAVSGLDSGDVNLTGNGLCLFVNPDLDDITTALAPSLSAWLEDQIALCGAPEPYWWQACPTA
jgi:hypothetical protein